MLTEDLSRVCIPSNALPAYRQSPRFACSYDKSQGLDHVVQTLVAEAPFPGMLADQGRHDFARLVKQQLLQVKQQWVQNCT